MSNGHRRNRLLDMISKREYWDALDDPLVDARLSQTRREILDLKHVQDAWILSKCARITNNRILEIGGGFGRVLRTLQGNERWNLDTVGGPGRTVSETKRRMPTEYTVVDAMMGEFSRELPSDYFDLVFSISVIEHVPMPANRSFWQDHARVLRAGGRAYHAIDFYIGDEPNDHVEIRLNAYIAGIQENGLSFLETPTIGRPVVFRSRYATNPDLAMRHWNGIVPKLRNVREKQQSVSLGMAVYKPF